jgi:hypothetical protein
MWSTRVDVVDERRIRDEQGRHLGVLKQVPKHTLKKQQVFKKKQ